MWDASAAAGLAAGSGALHGFAMGTPSGSSWRTEKVASRFLSLLQSASLQTFSAISGTTKKPNCRRHSHDRLVGSIAERYGKSLKANLSPKLGTWPIYSTSFFATGGLASFANRKVGIPFACHRHQRDCPTDCLSPNIVLAGISVGCCRTLPAPDLRTEKAG
jgi:hypothetical protein